MAIVFSQQERTVRKIRIQIGDECAEHNFGREVSLSHARDWALHFVNCFTSDDALPVMFWTPTPEITPEVGS